MTYSDPTHGQKAADALHPLEPRPTSAIPNGRFADPVGPPAHDLEPAPQPLWENRCSKLNYAAGLRDPQRGAADGAAPSGRRSCDGEQGG